MRFLLIFDAALFAMASTLAIVLGVVLILYSFHTDLSSRVSLEMSQVATVMACFVFLALPLGAAFWGLLRDKVWRWWAQLGAMAALVLGSLFLYRTLAA